MITASIIKELNYHHEQDNKFHQNSQDIDSCKIQKYQRQWIVRIYH